MFKGKGGEIIERVKRFLKPEPELELEELFILMNELKDELVDELKELVRAQPTISIPEIAPPTVEIPPVKVEIERPPLERPIRTFSQNDIEISGTHEFFKVEGIGELVFFTVISPSENFRVKIVIDNLTPPSYNNKTYSEYTLTAGTDPHLSADDDVIEGETIYKVTIKKLPFFRNVSGYVTTTEPTVFKIIEAQVAVE